MDTAAERRAYSNLGNAYVFQGKFDLATDCYKYVNVYFVYHNVCSKDVSCESSLSGRWLTYTTSLSRI